MEMKKTVRMKVVMLVLGMVWCGVSGQAQEAYSIRGKVNGVEDGTVILLGVQHTRQTESIAQDTVRDGMFSFAGRVDSLTLMARFGDGRSAIPPVWKELWVAPGAKVRVSGDDCLIRTWRVESDLPEQAEMNRYSERLRPYDLEQQVLLLQMQGMGRKDPRRDSLRNRMEVVQDSGWRVEVEMLETAPVTPYWMKRMLSHALSSQYSGGEYPFRDRLEMLCGRMSDVQKESPEGRRILSALSPAKPVAVGEEMVDGDLKDAEEKTHRLSEYLGKYILLDFWSSACRPCIAAMPEMKEIAEIFKDSVTVVSVSVDPRHIWRGFTEKREMFWANLWDEKESGGLAARYGAAGIPHYVLISPTGKVIDMWDGYERGTLKGRIGKALQGGKSNDKKM